VTLPAEVDDQELLQVRWVTVNAEGDDEWVGIDDIAVTGEVIVAGVANKAATPVSTAKPAIVPKEEGN
jgi:hypothetical protein